MGFRNAMVVAVAGWILTSLAFAQQGSDESGVERIRQLQREKRDVLKRRHETLHSLRSFGTVEENELYEAEMDFLDAELELATSEEDKLRVLRLRLKNRQSLEEYWNERKEHVVAGAVQLVDEALMATAKRIEAEIALLRLESKP